VPCEGHGQSRRGDGAVDACGVGSVRRSRGGGYCC
jgi:hypothetical protein